MDLIELNSIGLIPGPSETIEEFSKRVEYCLTLKEKIDQELKPKDSLVVSSKKEGEILEETFELTMPMYGFAPSWIPLFFSNSELLPWQAAAAWIFQCEGDAPTASFIQLRKALFNKLIYLDLYPRNEILAHELCHAARMMFNEPRYEELLAYRTSDRGFIRHFGPIIQNSNEGRLLVLMLLTIAGMDALFLYFAAYEAYWHALWLKLIPLGLILWGMIRLSLRQRTLNKTLSKLQQLVGDNASCLLFRLSDEEIEMFANAELSIIRDYAKNETSLRWKVINNSYGLK